MNWKMLALALIIYSAGVLSGGFVGHKATLKTNQSNLEQMTPTLNMAIEKSTNEIINKIDVPKIKKSEPVQIILSPNNEQIAVRDTCNTIDLTKLNNSQLKRLQRWLND